MYSQDGSVRALIDNFMFNPVYRSKSMNFSVFYPSTISKTFWARQVIKSNTDISDFSFSSADAKAILKNHILLTQKMGNSCEWNKYRVKLVLF